MPTKASKSPETEAPKAEMGAEAPPTPEEAESLGRESRELEQSLQATAAEIMVDPKKARGFLRWLKKSRFGRTVAAAVLSVSFLRIGISLERAEAEEAPPEAAAAAGPPGEADETDMENLFDEVNSDIEQNAAKALGETEPGPGDAALEGAPKVQETPREYQPDFGVGGIEGELVDVSGDIDTIIDALESTKGTVDVMITGHASFEGRDAPRFEGDTANNLSLSGLRAESAMKKIQQELMKQGVSQEDIDRIHFESVAGGERLHYVDDTGETQEFPDEAAAKDFVMRELGLRDHGAVEELIRAWNSGADVGEEANQLLENILGGNRAHETSVSHQAPEAPGVAEAPPSEAAAEAPAPQPAPEPAPVPEPGPSPAPPEPGIRLAREEEPAIIPEITPPPEFAQTTEQLFEEEKPVPPEIPKVPERPPEPESKPEPKPPIGPPEKPPVPPEPMPRPPTGERPPPITPRPPERPTYPPREPEPKPKPPEPIPEPKPKPPEPIPEPPPPPPPPPEPIPETVMVGKPEMQTMGAAKKPGIEPRRAEQAGFTGRGPVEVEEGEAVPPPPIGSVGGKGRARRGHEYPGARRRGEQRRGAEADRLAALKGMAGEDEEADAGLEELLEEQSGGLEPKGRPQEEDKTPTKKAA